MLGVEVLSGLTELSDGALTSLSDAAAESGTRVITIYPQGASVVYRILHMPCPRLPLAVHI